ncbi:MAG TPA: DNA recombination protein RmuC [Bryobacteraceae bacterium]|nr:DNA recombination protein RmuC [Bryobacteraceae bacterium]
MDTATFTIGIVLGLLIGGVLAGLWMRGRVQVAEAKLAVAASATDQFQAVADTALRSSQSAFLDAARATLETVRAQMTGDLAARQMAIEGVVRPLSDSLIRLERQVQEVESVRQHSFGGLQEQLQALARETSQLSSALRAPQIRGRWGELTLRRVAELAGMVKYCDFFEQSTSETNGARVRPDMIVRLPGGRTLVVDAKVPLTAYLDAMSAPDDAARRVALVRHGQQVLKQVEQLSAKQYWQQFDATPELVVLFLPGDHFLSAALEIYPALLEESIARRVFVATPMTLISVLRGAAFGWGQEDLARNAAEIRQLAQDLYSRAQIFLGHHAETGRQLARVVDAYNRSVGSLEARLLPSMRKMRDLGGAGGEEPIVPEPVDLAPRLGPPSEAG